MDEDLDDRLRRISAEQAAQQFIIDYLFRHLWSQIPREQRLKLAEGLLDASEQTAHLSGIAKNDDLLAANLADATVWMQQSIDQFVGRALKVTADAEEEAVIRRYRDR